MGLRRSRYYQSTSKIKFILSLSKYIVSFSLMVAGLAGLTANHVFKGEGEGEGSTMAKPQDSTLVVSALQVARGHKRDELKFLLQKLNLRSDSGASINEIWLAAESAYINGNYLEAIGLFDRFESDPRSDSAPRWQRYLSAHRRAFSLLQTTQISAAQIALNEAENLLWMSPELAFRYGELNAMRGHLQELQGDYESARASFILAHNAAISHDDMYRAATTASDLGRIYGILGLHADGLTWLARAETLIGESPNEHVKLTIHLRRAMIYIALGMKKEALAILDRLVPLAQRGTFSGLLAHTLAKRAEVLQLDSRFYEAERDMHHAIRTAAMANLPKHELYCHKDLALLYITRNSPGDPMRAVQEFNKALELANKLTPPQPLILVHLAESILATPALIGQTTLSSALHDDMTRTLERIDGYAHAGTYQIYERSKRLEYVTAHLAGILTSLQNEEIRLREFTVRPRLRKAFSRSGEVKRINPSELHTLKIIYHSSSKGVTIAEISEQLGKSLGATSKSVMRIRKIINNDLLVTRTGPRRYYSLRLAD